MKSVFITGAASGIGAETAKHFGRKGWFVGISDIDREKLETVAETIGRTKCSIHELDVTSHRQCVHALKAFSVKTDGFLNVLFNNAGILTVAPFESISPGQHGKIIDINVKGVINMNHSAFKYLKVTPGAHVISMSSASSIYGIPDFASYSASKFAVRSLTESLNLEWEKHDITVSDVMPPFVKTPMVDSQEYDSAIIKNMGVNLAPQDIAKEVFKLAHSSQMHRPVTSQFKLSWQLTRHLPLGITRRVMKRLYNSN